MNCNYHKSKHNVTIYVKILLLLIIFHLGVSTIYCQTPSAQTPFEFGNFLVTGSLGTVTLTSSSGSISRSSTGSILFLPSQQGTLSLPTFTVSSNGNSTINSININPITLYNQNGATITINNFIISPSPPTTFPIALNNNNKRTYNFVVTQAVLTTNGIPLPGTYTNSYTIVIQ